MTLIVDSAANQSLSITIYNDSFGLVKERRIVHVPEDCQEIQYLDVAKQIETDSIIVSGIEVLEYNYDYDLVNKEKLLEKYLDKVITIYDKKNDQRIKIRLLSVANGIIGENVKTKEILVDPMGELILPTLPDGLIVKPALIWKVKPTTNTTIDVSYLTKGMKWEGNYVIELKKNTFQLSGWVCIHNQTGATFSNTQIKLIAGDIHRIEEEYILHEENRNVLYSPEPEVDYSFSEKSFADYHLYTLQEKATLKDNQQKQINFIQVENAPYKKYYTFDRYSENGKIMIEFDNKKEDNLGIPLPKGKVKVYQQDDADASLEFIGEDQISHTPKNETIKLFLGNAFDLVCEGNEMKRYKEKWLEYVEYQYEVKNHKEHEAAEVVIEHYIYDRNWTMETSSQTFKEKDSQTITFTTIIQPDDKVLITFKYAIDNRVSVKLER